MKILIKIKLYFLNKKGNKKTISIVNDLNKIKKFKKLKHKNRILYILNGKIYVQVKNKSINVRYQDFWELFEEKHKLTDNEIKELMKWSLKQYLNISKPNIHGYIINLKAIENQLNFDY